MYYTVAN